MVLNGCLIFCGALPVVHVVFFFQAEDGIRDSVASRGLGDVYKRQLCFLPWVVRVCVSRVWSTGTIGGDSSAEPALNRACFN